MASTNKVPKSAGEPTNFLQTCYALDETMMKAHRADDNKKAVDTARSLLAESGLPPLIRARACMVVACSDEPDSLEMAEEGVRVAEMGFNMCENPGQTERQLVADCKTVLRQVQEALEEENMDDDEQEGDEVVWVADQEDAGVKHGGE